MEEIQLPLDNDRDRNNGMFKPGVSGNPLGRPKSDATIKELARSQTEAALNTLAEIMQNPKAPPSARVHAASALLDRGWGKPSQYIESMQVGTTLHDLFQRAREMEERYPTPAPQLNHHYIEQMQNSLKAMSKTASEHESTESDEAYT